MAIAGPAPGTLGEAPAVRAFSYRRLVNATFFVFISGGSIAFFEPSPFDVMFLLMMPLWFIGGFRVHRVFAVFFFLMLAYKLGGFISLTPYWFDADSVAYMFTSLYLMFVGFFFALFFAERTIERCELCLKAYLISNVIAASCGIVGYLDIAGTADLFTLYGRASGSFKDPNVLGGFLILGVLYCMRLLMLNLTRWRLSVAAILLVCLTGLLFTFSRGSYGAFVLSASIMIGSMIVTTKDMALRRKLLVSSLLVVGLVVLAIAALMTVDFIRELLLTRTSGEGYEDPRYFNQSRALPYLLEHPLGYGPLRFRHAFGLEPHSSFVNAFASFGWFGAFAFILLCAMTAFIGFRMCFKASPYRPYAQMFFPPTLAIMLQGFQIDIDHWRHLFMFWGIVWGLETARWRWMARTRRAAMANS
jgi:hypothetical protein